MEKVSIVNEHTILTVEKQVPLYVTRTVIATFMIVGLIFLLLGRRSRGIKVKLPPRRD